MKTLLYIFMFISVAVWGQTETELEHKFYAQYEKATKNAPQLSDVDAAIETTEALRQSKTDKTNISLYLANLYHIKGTKFDAEAKQTTGLKSRGVVPAPQQAEALAKAKTLYAYFLEHYSVNDDHYRTAKNALASINI